MAFSRKNRPATPAAAPAASATTPAAPAARSEFKGSASAKPTSRSITHDLIAKRAFEIYAARGYAPGNADEDWHEAERQLRAGL